MANQNDDLYGFTGLFPIKRGEVELLRTYLRDMDSDPNGSPLYRARRIYLARFVIVDHLPVERHPAAYDTLRSVYLLVMCDFDGSSVAALVEDIVANARDVAEAIWGHCRGCPSIGDTAQLEGYFEKCQLPTNLFLADQPKASVSAILSALELQRRFISFVQDHQDMPAENLQSAFEEFMAEIDCMGELPAGMVTECERKRCLDRS
jgi:hypothetical protein